MTIDTEKLIHDIDEDGSGKIEYDDGAESYHNITGSKYLIYYLNHYEYFLLTAFYRKPHPCLRPGGHLHENDRPEERLDGPE